MMTQQCESFLRHRQQDWSSATWYYKNAVGLTSMPTDIPHDALHIEINYNRIERIETDAFSQQRQCTSVRMLYNWVSVVEPGAFNGLTAVSKFQFCHNRLGRLFVDIFSDLNGCSELDLYENGIIEIEPGSFNGLSHVKILDLHSNGVTSLTAETLQGLIHVTTLKLHRNELESLNSDTFSGLNSLEELHLYGNFRFTSLPAHLFNLLPRPLKLALQEPSYDQPKDIALQCDVELCWLKQEELQETVKWWSTYINNFGSFVFKPRCSNEIDWDTWECDGAGSSLVC